ncbi:MAG TPA: hypothetical protein VJL81_15845 [Solirubrobacterales bacterium]|nr:hypothetical protein [Solirubrobacterales bacterium]
MLIAATSGWTINGALGLTIAPVHGAEAGIDRIPDAAFNCGAERLLNCEIWQSRAKMATNRKQP